MPPTPALLLLATVCALTQTEAAPPAAAQGTSVRETTQREPVVDLESDSPPAGSSEYDKRRAGNQGSREALPEEQSLLGQLGRTLFGLLVVVGLIYILGKIAIAKLGKVGFAGRSGKNLRVVERLQLDPRNALYIVQVEDGPLLLLGSGEKGMQLITELDGAAEPDKGKGQSAGRSFSNAMVEAAQRELEDEAKPVDIAAKGTG